GLGAVYDDQKDYDKAIEAYQKAIALDPKFAYPHNNLGNVYKAQGDYDKAIDAYQNAIKLDPKYASPHNGLGWLYLTQDNFAAAADHFNQAITIAPGTSAYLFNLGITFARQGDLTQAQATWQKALALYAGNTDWAKATIAFYTIALGDVQQGLADLKALTEKGLQPAALRDVLGDAEQLLKCPTEIPGIEAAATLLRQALA
ncbi:MAG: tetratricopeptide repeat protein, partial [Cyanobacteria bacterium]|nr:tetratricopeptide repeat protein [Cyanobacteriota bacterium]